MRRRISLVMAITAVTIMGGCERSGKNAETAATAPAGGQSSAAMPTDTSGTAEGNGGAPAEGDALLQDNDRAIAENKRMVAMLSRYQNEDFDKYERLRKGCEAQARGTLADRAAPVVARCIEAGW